MGVLSALLLFVHAPSASGSDFQVLHNFGASGDGAVPEGAPVIDSNGKLYGVTAAGGAGMCSDYGCGAVYELAPQPGQWNETILYSFDFQTNGSSPLGPLALDPDGNLYGATSVGGATGLGVSFELSPEETGWDFTTIYPNGSDTGFALGAKGDLYGFVGSGTYHAGAISELSPSPNVWDYTQLYSFCSLPHCPGGWGPKYPLTWDTKGNLYGTAYDGGANSRGVAFQLSLVRATSYAGAMWTYHIMHSFAAFPTDGGLPGSGLTLDSEGNAYGASLNGGAHGNGAIYKLTPFPPTPWTWKEIHIYDFPVGLGGGGFPTGTMVFDKAGNLYGTAGGGIGCGSRYGCGVVFKLAPGANGFWTYSVVHNFSGTDGAGPIGLAIDENGNLFGTTQTGGTYNEGVAFEITP